MRLYLLVIFVFVLVVAFLLSKEADAQVPPAGFSNSIPFDCNSSQVDTDLYNFPVRLVLGGSVGITNEDLTLVFDEIGNNYLKIAITTELGAQCYTEVAYWASGSESAEVWFKAPYLSSSSDTRFYFHYDATASNNTSYVGVPGSAVAQNIWDSDYVGVYHLNENSLRAT